MPAKMTNAETAQQLMAIARRDAARKLAQVRETLLGLSYDWSPIDQTLQGQFTDLLNDLDDLVGCVALVDIEVS